MEDERIEIARASFALFHREQNLLRPRQPAPTRCAPAARFLRKEVLEIPHHADRTGAVIQHNHGSRAQAASRSLHVPIVHGRVQVLLYQEVGRCSARQQPPKTEAVAHSSCVVHENLPHRRAHRKLPKSWFLNFAADAEQLRTSVFSSAQASEPIGPFVHDVVNIAKRLDILDDGRFAPKSGDLREWRLRSRMRSLSFECIQQSGLLAADITASAYVKMNLKTVARSQNVAAEIVACPCFCDRS